MKTNPCLGSSIEAFLKKEGIFDQVNAKALKTAIAYELQEILNQSGMTQTELAKKMGTSRAAVRRLLNPETTSVTLHTLDKVAQALGKKLHISFD
jgi:antitoxin HicB